MHFFKKIAFLSLVFIIAFFIAELINIDDFIYNNKQVEKVSEISTTKKKPELKCFKGVIGSGKTIYEIFAEKKVAHTEIMKLIGSFKNVCDLTKVRENQTYSFFLTPLKEIKKFSYKKDILSSYIAERDGNEFTVLKKDIEFTKKIVAKSFKIKNSLYNSIVSQKETGTLVNKIANIFSWDIDFYLDTKEGDKIKILFEKFYKGEKLVKYGNILSVQYIAKNKVFSAFYFKNGKSRGYYDEKGRPLKKLFLRLPLKFGRVTSKFSIRRFHPVDKRYKAHKGIDYGAPIGTPIFATADGVVSFSGRNSGYGKLIILRNTNGYKTYYAHCNRLLVRKGAKVKQGQMIAKVGKTGKVTGPHVHYEIRYKNKPVNPSTMITSKSKPIRKHLKKNFIEIKKSRLALVESLLLKKQFYLTNMKKEIKGNKG
ncbi:MAG: M23 family metallopeptidase [Desulfobacterales bacterium]|nr:M23 family metallopeptidase [Desulfobacterales bacterium]